jgi:hypothetical protein
MRPTADRVREIFDYDPGIGIFRWRIKARGRVRGGGRGIEIGDQAGSPIGNKKKGGWRLKIDRVEYPAACVARDRDRMNNRWNNLREATRSQNHMNRGNFPHSSPYKGVTFDTQTGRWRASICVDGKLVALGRHDSPELAHQFYVEAARKYFGEFARSD